MGLVCDFMDLKNCMIIIDGKIRTNDIIYFKYNITRNVFVVRYKNSKVFYTYSKELVKVLKNSKLLDLKKYDFFHDGKRLGNIKEIYEFKDNDNSYYLAIFFNNSYKSFTYEELIKVDKEDNIINFLKDILLILVLNNDFFNI